MAEYRVKTGDEGASEIKVKRNKKQWTPIEVFSSFGATAALWINAHSPDDSSEIKSFAFGEDDTLCGVPEPELDRQGKFKKRTIQEVLGLADVYIKKLKRTENMQAIVDNKGGLWLWGSVPEPKSAIYKEDD